MAGNTTGEGELLVQSLQSLDILADIRVYFAVGTLKIRVCDEEVAAVSGTGDQDHVQIILVDGTIHVRIDKVLSGNGSPVSYNLLLDLLSGQRLSQKRIVQ